MAVSLTEPSIVCFVIRCNAGGVLGIAYTEVLYNFPFSQNLAGTMRSE
jgi:hypothetical protein